MSYAPRRPRTRTARDTILQHTTETLMGLRDMLRRQMRSVLHWQDDDRDTVFQRLPTPGDEIKNASRLIVGPGQGCLLIYEGRIVDEIPEQTTLSLKTDNHPFLTTLASLPTLFESPHKLQLYFYRTTLFPGLRWGTAQPVRYLDPVYRLPLGVGMNGSYSLRLADARTAFLRLCAGEASTGISRIKSVLDAQLPQFIAATLAGAAWSCTDIDSHLDEIGARIHERLALLAGEYGLAVPEFAVNGSILDRESRERLETVFAMRARQQAAEEVHLSYERLQQLEAVRDAARSENGLAGAGLQLGAGLDLAAQLRPLSAPSASADDLAGRLRLLHQLLGQGLISQQDFEERKRALLERI